MASNKIQIKPRTRLEFARLFCDEKNYSDQAAYYWLRNEIKASPELLQNLQQLGYTPYSKQLTIKQQDLILSHFGL